ncbi:DUF5856 family protein [Shigella sonnei]
MALKATALFAMLGLTFALSPPIEANVDPHFDKFGEQYLGYSGRKYTPSIPDASKLPTDTIRMIDHILDQSNSIYKEMPPAIQSTIDDITGMFYQSKYLLSLE